MHDRELCFELCRFKRVQMCNTLAASYTSEPHPTGKDRRFLTSHWYRAHFQSMFPEDRDFVFEHITVLSTPVVSPSFANPSSFSPLQPSSPSFSPLQPSSPSFSNPSPFSSTPAVSLSLSPLSLLHKASTHPSLLHLGSTHLLPLSWYTLGVVVEKILHGT